MAVFSTVCIVDDDDLFLTISKAIMEEQSFADRIVTFADGAEAINFLRSADKTLPEVLFLDINMPMLDGWEFIEALEELSLHDKMKIYITSSSIDPADLKKAQENPNIQQFISKPISPETLEKILREH